MTMTYIDKTTRPGGTLRRRMARLTTDLWLPAAVVVLTLAVASVRPCVFAPIRWPWRPTT